ncbi:MAG: helix-turn-helix transcriptional regulator [Syntrophobacteraceae bacterium]|jgi:transcriptional regulator with XRE-family HTH domain
MPKKKEGDAVKLTLGQYLASIRTDRGMTLRQVEQLTDKEVSNAYLSQIENDKIKQPSPNILHALAESYEIDYMNLMEMAGHIRPTKSRKKGEKHGCLPTFAEHNITPEEEVELMDFLQHIRTRKPK